MLDMHYAQQSNQGCLVVSLLYLFQIEPTHQLEKQILSEGLFRLRESYALGCVLAFLDHHQDASLTIHVDNKYYLGMLQNWVDNPRIHLVHAKNSLGLLESLTPPFIAYVDNHITDGWIHLPHFLLVTGSTNKFFTVFDPWSGKTAKISKRKLLTGIELLRDHIKLCPLVITADQ